MGTKTHFILFATVFTFVCKIGVNSQTTTRKINVQTEKESQCKYKFYSEADGWLKLHRIPATWRDARLRCQLEGAVLMSPLTQALGSAMRSVAVWNRIDVGVFTGVHATRSKGDFVSIEGVRLDNMPHEWANGEPNNLNDEEQCLVMLRDGTLSDVSCKNTHPYICYKNIPNLHVTNCGTTDKGYTLDSRTGKCYKFSRIPRSFSRSNMACLAEGGHLAIINSETEAQVIRDLFVRNPPGTMVGTFLKTVAFLGFYDWGETGEWRTIFGETLEEAGYARWAQGDPNNSTTGESCGACYNNAQIIDIWCENPYPFICEKDPADIVC